MSESDPTFPVVAIGASAGGLEACRQMLSCLPPDSGMAFVLVQHLDPAHESQLSHILARSTLMPVIEATDGMQVHANHFYVIPPNAALEMVGDNLRVISPAETTHPHLVVDRFLRSLAKAVNSRAVAVILSGTGADGTLGVCEIKAAGGVTIAQDAASAVHSGMPQSAALSGSIDFVLPPAEIAARLLRLVDGHPYLHADLLDVPDQEDFDCILRYVREVTSVDFSHYRESTIKRRVLRRAMLFGQKSLPEYFELLKRDPGEVQALYRDLLINVTSFFRDPELFKVLQTSVFPRILAEKATGVPVRIWIPGCSTGQEAYSIAMALMECLDANEVQPPIQIFATDLRGENALAKARAGLYPDSIESEISPERLRRFFTKEGNLYRVRKFVREICIFAQQNITIDPPFSHVDLISCRNVMIYMSPALQQRVLPIFHYALNVPGFLVLGSSESVGAMTVGFDLVDQSWKVYAKRPVPLLYPHAASARYGPMSRNNAAATKAPRAPDFNKAAERVLLDRYAPPGVLINSAFDILQFHGGTGDYLRVPAGEPTTSLIKMAPEGLFLELRSAVSEASETHQPVLRKDVRMRVNGEIRKITLDVTPVTVTGAEGHCFLVLFDDSNAGRKHDSSRVSHLRGLFRRVTGVFAGTAQPGGAAELKELRQELGVTKEYMQSLLAQQDVANEELRSSSEEVMSSNEELQSTNEELETAKEELQSANEELTTVNDQLSLRNTELAQANNHFVNLLNSAGIPLVVVDGGLRIRFFTPQATQTMNLLSGDVDRPITDIKPAIAVDNLEDLIHGVLNSLQPLRDDVQDREGHWHSLRIYPYRTSDNRIDGAVIVLIDIDDMRRAKDQLQQQSATLTQADQRKNEFLAMLSHELRNPLAPMGNALQIIDAPGVKPADVERAHDVLRRQFTQITHIVEDLLDATRISHGKIEIHRQCVELGEVIKAAMESSHSIFVVRGHKLEVELCPAPMSVDADPVRLNQILVNLLNNAAMYTDAHGEIKIGCRCEEHNGKREAVITVRDNGRGIPPELLPHVFELFTQGEDLENQRHSGLGVGLALARKLIEMHDGSIEARSEGVGKGSEFTVRLPLVDVAPTPSAVATSHPDQNRCRVLIIEDNADQAETLAMLLAEWGHDVKTASNGTAGIELALEYRPDVALVDLGLPGLSGFEIAHRIRAHTQLKHTLLVAQTGLGQTQDRQRARTSGFDHHLVKPLDPDELRAVLASVQTRPPA